MGFASFIKDYHCKEGWLKKYKHTVNSSFWTTNASNPTPEVCDTTLPGISKISKLNNCKHVFCKVVKIYLCNQSHQTQVCIIGDGPQKKQDY